MEWSKQWIAFNTLLRKEIIRFTRIWVQTILPPAITTVLYFVIFGKLVGSQLSTINGYPYIDYIVPGLILMTVISNSYANVVSSFFSAKFHRNIEEMIISPTPSYVILAGFIVGGVARGDVCRRRCLHSLDFLHHPAPHPSGARAADIGADFHLVLACRAHQWHLRPQF